MESIAHPKSTSSNPCTLSGLLRILSATTVLDSIPTGVVFVEL